MAAMNGLTDRDVNDDTAAILSYFDSNDRVRPGAVGTIGHCMGGRYSLTTAVRFPHRIVASASLYGSFLVTDKPDSAHLHCAGAKAEMYYAFGGLDGSTPPAKIAKIEAAMKKARIKYAVDVFADAGHAYTFVERFRSDTPNANEYAPQSSETTWRKVFALWDRHLKPTRR